MNGLAHLHLGALSMRFDVGYRITQGLFPGIGWHVEVPAFLEPLIPDFPIPQTHPGGGAVAVPHLGTDAPKTARLLSQGGVLAGVESLTRTARSLISFLYFLMPYKRQLKV